MLVSVIITNSAGEFTELYKFTASAAMKFLDNGPSLEMIKEHDGEAIVTSDCVFDVAEVARGGRLCFTFSTGWFKMIDCKVGEIGLDGREFLFLLYLLQEYNTVVNLLEVFKVKGVLTGQLEEKGMAQKPMSR